MARGEGGRQVATRRLDFSAWTETPHEAPGAIAQTVADGSMPPVWYPWFHKGAKLSKQERAELLAGLQRTFGSRSTRSCSVVISCTQQD